MFKSRKAALIGAAMLFYGATAQAGPVAYSVDTVSDTLYTIDLMTGASTAIGNAGDVGFGDVEGLSFQPSTNILFGLDDTTDQLITIDTTTGVGTAVGALGANFSDSGLAFASDGTLYGASDLGSNDGFYSIDTGTGAASLINGSASDAHALAFYNGVMYGILDATNGLYSIDLVTGNHTLIGNLGISTDEDGFIIDSSGVGYLLQDNIGGNIYTIDLTTGAATVSAAYSCTTCRFESAAITTVPEPGTLTLLSLGIVGASLARRKRST